MIKTIFCFDLILLDHSLPVCIAIQMHSITPSLKVEEY